MKCCEPPVQPQGTDTYTVTAARKTETLSTTLKEDHFHDTDKSALFEDQYLGHLFSTKNCLQTT